MTVTSVTSRTQSPWHPCVVTHCRWRKHPTTGMKTVLCELSGCFMCVNSHPSAPKEDCFQNPHWFQSPKMLKSLLKWQSLCIWPAFAQRLQQGLLHITPFSRIQHSAQHAAISSFAFSNFLGYFSPKLNIFDLWLVKSTDGKPTDMEGWQYTYMKHVH